MVEMRIAYQGDLRCEATHGPSGMRLETDAPKDNQGKGEAFSPTDLVATAAATCIITILAIQARRHGLDISGTTATVRKDMTSEPVRRIGRLTIEVRVPTEIPEESRGLLERSARGCPVVKSLHPDIEVPLRFVWGKEGE